MSIHNIGSGQNGLECDKMRTKVDRCPECAKDGVIRSLACVDGDDTGLCFMCTRCARIYWVDYDMED